MFIKGILLAICVFLLDQGHKWYMLYVVDIANRPPIEVSSFFNLVMVWNRGISFGLFQNVEKSQWVFSFIALAVCIILLVWLYRLKTLFPSLAIGLVVGGATGNITDRLNYGAVADFFDFHVAGYHWPAFNIADSAVFIGAIMLCVDCLWGECGTQHKEENTE